MTLSTKPKVLKLGDFEFSQARWDELSQIAEIINCESQNRDEFINDLQTKYNDITYIAREYNSVNVTGRFDSEIAQHIPSTVKGICHCTAGYDSIDVEPFSKLGIQISNVTDPVVGPTADVAVFLVLACLRNFFAGHKMLVSGKWPDEKVLECGGVDMGNTPQHKVLGILGMGNIGRAVKNRLKVFGFKKIVYYNRRQLSPELEEGAEYVSQDELLQKSDVIVVVVPLNPNTKHLIDRNAISKMKDGVILVNISRGLVLDEPVVTELVKSGKIGAFGADVFENEPHVSPDLYNLPNVVTLPHMGTHAFDATQDLQEWVIENIECCIKTGKLKTLVAEQKELF